MWRHPDSRNGEIAEQHASRMLAAWLLKRISSAVSLLDLTRVAQSFGRSNYARRRRHALPSW